MSADALTEWRLAEHLDRLRDADQRDNSLIRLSGAGDCSRKIAYRMAGEAREADSTREMVTFQIGHSFHAMVQRWLVEMGWVLPEMLEYTLVDPVRRIRGTADAFTVPLDTEGNPLPTQVGLELVGKAGRRVVEIKSITNTPDEEGMAGAFDRLKGPRDTHIDQATCYAALWNEQHPAASDQVLLLTFIYVAKDKGGDVPFRVFTQKFSDRRWKRLQAKFAAIWAHRDAGTLPPRDYDPTSKFSPCGYCPYKAQCLLEGLDGENGPDDPFDASSGLEPFFDL